jgi:16S rRNA C1402 (ribose-2'-O) methylase RsmI
MADRARNGSLTLRGEFVLVIGAWQATGSRAEPRVDAVPGLRGIGTAAMDRETAARAEVERLVEAGVGRGEAARRVAAATGIPRRRLYGARAAGGTEPPATS